MLDATGDLVDFAIIDPADAAWASQFSWCLSGNGYAIRSSLEGGRTVMRRLHRDLLGLARGDGLIVDHINRNRLDNRRVNLRLVTPTQNAQNLSPRQDGTSRYRGVHWQTRDQKWYAVVWDRGHSYFLGSFESEDDAGEACRRARSWLLPHSID